MSKRIVEKVLQHDIVIWDWNGTLINDAIIAWEAESEVFKKYGLPLQTHEQRIKNFCFPIEVYYKKMGFDFTKISYEKVANEWLEIYERMIQEVPFFEGVPEMLKELHAKGKRQFVLSAAPEVHIKEIVSKKKIHHYLEAVYGLADAKAESKINRGRDLIRDCNIDVKTAILVGDTVHDFEVGEALGTDVLLIADGHHPYETLLEVHHNVLKTRG